MIAQARACLNVPAGATWQMAAVGTIALLAAALLLAGFMTPLASAVAVAISLLGVMPSMTYVFAIALAIVLLGPGAFSVDARLFGRRVIVIAEP